MCDCQKFQTARTFPYNWNKQANAFLCTAKVCKCGHLEREHKISWNGDKCLATTDGKGSFEDSRLG